jgi:hypothetical protein
MIERTEQRFQIKPAYLAADTAYGSADTLNWIINQKKIAPHIPVIDKSKREDGTFSREDFRFDPEQNIYLCPAGKVLTTTGHIGPDHAIRYQASLSDCRICDAIFSQTAGDPGGSSAGTAATLQQASARARVLAQKMVASHDDDATASASREPSGMSADVLCSGYYDQMSEPLTEQIF